MSPEKNPGRDRCLNVDGIDCCVARFLGLPRFKSLWTLGRVGEDKWRFIDLSGLRVQNKTKSP